MDHCNQPWPCIFKLYPSFFLVLHHHHSHPEGKIPLGFTPLGQSRKPPKNPGSSAAVTLGFPHFMPSLLQFHFNCISYHPLIASMSLEPVLRPWIWCDSWLPCLWSLAKYFDLDSLLWFFSHLVSPNVKLNHIKPTNI